MDLHASKRVSSADLEVLIEGVKRSAAGPAEGIFGPGSLSWRVNRESALFLGAGRAALLQLAHPWVAAAIAGHSRTLRDPVGRFHQTFRVMFTIVFGSLEQALEAARHLHARHASIRGSMSETAGPFTLGSAYHANEVSALRWVYATLVDSALLAYELVLPPLMQREREQYYAESQTTAAMFGIPREALPRNWQAFERYFGSMLRSEELTMSSAARELAQHLQAGTGSRLRPPSWYKALTTELLPVHLREEFQLPYGEWEHGTAERVRRWLPSIYRRLPSGVRFVGPYLEAQAKLRGARPGFAVRLNNRLWVGESSLLG